MKRILFAGVILLCSVGVVLAQNQKPALDYSVYDTWKSLSAKLISSDGKWISYEINPSVGDGLLFFEQVTGGQKIRIPRGDAAQFSQKADFFAYKIKPFADSVRQAKIKKVKKDKMPSDTLVVFIPGTGETLSFEGLKGFKVAPFESSVIAYQLEELPEEEKDTASENAGEKEEGEIKEKTDKKKKEKNKKYKGSKLNLLNPLSKEELILDDVTQYTFAPKGQILHTLGILEDSVNTSTVQQVDLKKMEVKLIWKGEGVAKKLVGNKMGDKLTFLFSPDTTDNKVFGLYYWEKGMDLAELLVDSLTKGMPEGYSVSENGSVRFANNDKYISLGVAETPVNEPEEKDTLLAEDRVKLDIWHWQEPVLQSMQLKRVGQEKKKSFQAIVHLKDRSFVQMGSKDAIEQFRLPSYGNAEWALGLNDRKYELSNAINFISFKDVYLKNIKTGAEELVFENVSFSPSLSPFGKYLYWWEPADSQYYAYQLETKKMLRLTEGLGTGFAIDNNDYPEDTRSWGSMGWSKDDQAFFVYDKYDVWKFDPSGKTAPYNVTKGFGKAHDLRIRYSRVDRDEEYLNEKSNYYFNVFNLETMESGFYQGTLKSGELKKLIYGGYSFTGLTKAEDADQLIWSKANVQDYPELYVSDLNFGAAKKLTETNPQQADYNWMSVELVEWMDFNGAMHKGLLYKPENFDPNKEYPMMVYFYRLHAQDLYRHITPRASYSTINAAFYASNGYLVFMPDVYFEIGNPGKSAFNSIVSGVMALGKERSYIDMARLALQGQSWGGYQTAYIITQTDLFAAASPGAPVSNMTSAYGGIRTSSGMCRQVQYEKGQSRIGGSLWDKPVEYFENSPLFYAHKCNTPCLIRHNDNDGAVPFAQGVEFFVALRRLGRPAWLLNYNGGPHNLTAKLSNRKDLSVRMKQFFDHYLMDAEAPEWLSKGVKAVDKQENETFYLNYMK